jgi:oligoribonuclease NrnB/cAMP/cGMP phosphodiesterase (DHH superfamily)
MICFYHDDMDGFCSASLIKQAYPSTELQSINYGDPPPLERAAEHECVFIVDFTLQPHNLMFSLKEKVERLVWIDHHKSAIEWAETSGFKTDGVTRAEGWAACELVWCYLHADPMPRYVQLLGSYDIWDHRDPDVVPFQYAMRAGNMDPGYDMTIWDSLRSTPSMTDYLVKAGQFILLYVENHYARVADATAFEVQFEGLRFIAANAPKANSNLFDTVFDPQRHDAMMLFYWSADQWVVGLYGDGDPDLSEIAVRYGGGGHAGAAGFECSELPFELTMNERGVAEAREILAERYSSHLPGDPPDALADLAREVSDLARGAGWARYYKELYEDLSDA